MNHHYWMGLVSRSKVNALTDLTVGYMAAPWQGGRMTEHQQYCVVRNHKGQQMLDLLTEKLDVGQVWAWTFPFCHFVGSERDWMDPLRRSKLGNHGKSNC